MYAEEHGRAEEWGDVMEMVRARLKNQRARAEMFTRESQMDNLSERPVYGPLVRAGALVYGPTNELGVVCLFCSLAEELGFLILQVRTGYPDCEAMRVVDEGRLKPLLIEFEFKSRNFLMHKHDPARCDLIVCWEHNWLECPLEVVELKTEFERLQREGRRGSPQMNADWETNLPWRHGDTEKDREADHRDSGTAEEILRR